MTDNWYLSQEQDSRGKHKKYVKAADTVRKWVNDPDSNYLAGKGQAQVNQNKEYPTGSTIQEEPRSSATGKKKCPCECNNKDQKKTPNYVDANRNFKCGSRRPHKNDFVPEYKQHNKDVVYTPYFNPSVRQRRWKGSDSLNELRPSWDLSTKLENNDNFNDNREMIFRETAREEGTKQMSRTKSKKRRRKSARRKREISEDRNRLTIPSKETVRDLQNWPSPIKNEVISNIKADTLIRILKRLEHKIEEQLEHTEPELDPEEEEESIKDIRNNNNSNNNHNQNKVGKTESEVQFLKMRDSASRCSSFETYGVGNKREFEDYTEDFVLKINHESPKTGNSNRNGNIGNGPNGNIKKKCDCDKNKNKEIEIETEEGEESEQENISENKKVALLISALRMIEKAEGVSRNSNKKPKNSSSVAQIISLQNLVVRAKRGRKIHIDHLKILENVLLDTIREFDNNNDE